MDLQCAKSRGIAVTNIAEYGTDSVAQAVFAHILNIANKTEEHSQSARAGDWSKCADICYCLAPLTEIAGKAIGIVGYGAIGRKVAQIAKAFGMGSRRILPEQARRGLPTRRRASQPSTTFCAHPT